MNDDLVRVIKPIFILFTRSFWLGYLPAVLTFFDFLFSVFTEPGNEPVAAAIAYILNPLFGWDEQEIRGFMVALSPLYAIVMFHQRSGGKGKIPRPITLNPSTAKTLEVVEDGQAAFEAGKAIGKAMRNQGIKASPVTTKAPPPIPKP